ncbi:MAG: V-type ATP synthase subunit E [Sedimentisphaerales bacterium]|nr:V-type ATP synthase subunit E [Sedimentisphaerales bacterium]
MDGEQVIEKILADARAEAEKFKKEARAKQAQEQAKLDEQLADFRKQTETLAQKAGDNAKAQVLSGVRMALAKETLVEKAKILDEVFAKAEQQIKQMPDEQYRAMMGKLLADSIRTGEEEVIVDVNEKRIDQQLLSNVNQQLASKGKGNLKLSGDKQPIGGGFILKKGKIKNNASLKVLLSRARNTLDIELAKELFGG